MSSGETLIYWQAFKVCDEQVRMACPLSASSKYE
jgi:hypothetical protein